MKKAVESDPEKPDDDDREEFASMAEGSQPGLIKEFYAFLRTNKKWWLVPIIVALLIALLVVLIGGSPLAPFLYPLF